MEKFLSLFVALSCVLGSGCDDQDDASLDANMASSSSPDGGDGSAPTPAGQDGAAQAMQDAASIPGGEDGGTAAPGQDGSALPADGGAGEPALPPPQCSGDGDASAACGACTHQGLVEGQPQGATCEYLGIPYAKPPVAALRFMPPEPAPAWAGVRRANAFGAACVQSLDLSLTDNKSEDCLFLNVWTPSMTPAAPLPVMVFIYGGGYSGGATNTYSGIGLSRKGPAVVVSMNYRVGALGFFAHPELDRQRASKPSGSDGIRDQQLALQWVKDNIASFHGDPNNVTVFGESAGSSSVCVHLVSPGSRSLARRFIMESGVCTSGVGNGVAAMPRDKAYGVSQQMVSALCAGAADPIACLRALPADQVIQWAPTAQTDMNLSWAPVVEGPGGVLPEHPDALLQRGAFNRGEVLIGTNKNEFGLFQLLPIFSMDELRSTVERQFGAKADEIVALYPEAASDPNQALITLMTDVMFRCGSRRLARSVSAMGSAVYLYSFEQGAAWHADEMGYVFGDGYYALGIFPPVETLANVIQGYWTSFAKSGDPNATGLVPWPKYTQASDQHLRLLDPPVSGSALQRSACDYWDNYRAAP